MANVNIRKRGKVYQYQFEAASVDGKRKQITKSGFKTKAEAEEARAKKKDRVVDHIISGVGTVLPVLATGIMYAVGMNFEKTGTLTSTFFRNLVGKMKVTK